MRIGVVTEIKKNERRVALTPTGTREAVAHGHEVLVQKGAGVGSNITDDAYAAAGATLVDEASAVITGCDLLVHVKEPQPEEIALLRPGQILFTYLHLAAYPEVARGLMDRGVTAIAYETVTMADGSLPLLAPMSYIAGRLAVQAGATTLEAPYGGKGVLLGGYPGVPAAKVTVLGAGSAGMNAVDVAIGMGARVTLLDLDQSKLAHAEERWGTRVTTQFSSLESVEEWVLWADLVVGAVLVAGKRAPVLVTADHVRAMEPGTVLVDISIDQGGCFATSHETTHADPTYVVDGVVHYAVGNIPGAVPATSTRALTNATMRYVVSLADGLRPALESHPELVPGVNVAHGKIVNPAVADSLGLEAAPLDSVLG